MPLIIANAGCSETQRRHVVAGEDFFFLHSKSLYAQAEAGPICISPVELESDGGNMSLQA